MRFRKRQRLMLVLLALLLVGGASALVLAALGSTVAFFVTPGDIQAGKVEPGRHFRIGGLVVPGSVERGGTDIRFRLGDGAGEVQVSYRGILPDLFREGQGIVAQGQLLPDGSFSASEVLAKHDETYMPREVADALKRSDHWHPEAAAPAAATETGSGS